MMKSPLLIACDFDGTVTREDTLVELLNRFGDPHWPDVQRRVVSGELSIREGLERQMGSLKANPQQVTQLLEERITVEPSFLPFLDALRARGIPVILLSGGFDLCIETVMRRTGVWPLPYLANRLRRQNGTWKVEFPYPSLHCQACGHCKADPLRTWNRQGYTTVFVGNGVTDRCPARVANLTFAKEELGRWCQAEGISVAAYESFDTIMRELERRDLL